MRVTVFGARSYDRQYLAAANADGAHELIFLDPDLEVQTAALAAGSEAVCVFVNDRLDAETLEILAGHGVRLIALRCAVVKIPPFVGASHSAI